MKTGSKLSLPSLLIPAVGGICFVSVGCNHKIHLPIPQLLTDQNVLGAYGTQTNLDEGIKYFKSQTIDKQLAQVNQGLTNKLTKEMISSVMITPINKEIRNFTFAINLNQGYVFDSTEQNIGESPKDHPISYIVVINQPVLSTNRTAKGTQENVFEGGDTFSLPQKIQQVNQWLLQTSQLTELEVKSIDISLVSPDDETKFFFEIILKNGYSFDNNTTKGESSKDTPITYSN